MEAFRIALEMCKLQPLEYRDDHFTRVRNMTEVCIKERLDWAMVPETWLDWFSYYSLTHLDFYHSDHMALHLRLEDSSGLHSLNEKKRIQVQVRKYVDTRT